jgi:hypothetical protein
MTNVGLVGPGAPWVPRRRHGWRGPATRSSPSTSTSTHRKPRPWRRTVSSRPATISDAATDADVLVLMVATAGQAESVLYGDGEAAPCSSSAEYTSPSPAKPSPTPRRSAWTPAPPGKSSGTAPQPPSCSRTAAPGWSTTPNNDIKSSIDIFVKDMGLVTEAARHTYPTALASATEQLYPAGRRASLGRADDSFLIQVLRATPPWMTTSPVRYSQIPAAVTGSRSRMASHGLTGVSGYLRDLCRYTLVGIAPKIRCRTLAIAGGRGRYPGRCRG